MSVKFVKPNDELLQYVAEHMRDIDVLECKELSGRSPVEALVEGVKISDFSSVVVINGRPCAVIGLTVISYLTGTGVPWMLATYDAVENRRLFVRHSSAGLAEMMTTCPNLVNYVHEDNTIAIRWLKWMGFSIEQSKPMGENDAMFCRFTMGNC